MTYSWIAGRTSKLVVYGPEGVDSIVSGFDQAYKLDAGYRFEHHKPLLNPENHGFEYITIPYPDSQLASVNVFTNNDKGMKVLGFQVDHSPVKPAYGYRFELNGRVVVVSGDTCKCDSLIENARGAHVLVQEVICCEFAIAVAGVHDHFGNDFIARILKDVTTYHTSFQDCVGIAAAARVPVMLLTHLVPAPDNFFIERLYFLDVKRPSSFHGDVVIGEDGMIYKVTESRKVEMLSSGRKKKLNMKWMLSFVCILIGLALCVKNWAPLGLSVAAAGLAGVIANPRHRVRRLAN